MHLSRGRRGSAHQLLSPSICFVSSAKGNGVRGSGGVKDFAEGKDHCWLKFLFRVDDGGVPSVHSAR